MLRRKYTVGQTECSTKKYQIYNSEFYLAGSTLYKDQEIKITSSCDVWMTELVISVATVVGYNRYHMPRNRIEEALDVSLGYSNPCGFHILLKFI
ncbi:uncharacterized protein TNCV_1291631 [Trichonephila clavipes]|nr:uncharacterized protein TNCV_1291631 [Trichonephila clavipes]